MTMLKNALLTLAAAGLLFGCGPAGQTTGTSEAPRLAKEPAPAPTPTPAPVAGGDWEVSLEAEAFKANGPKVKDLKEASGGKALHFETGGSAELTLDLAADDYRLKVYAMAPDDTSDAFYVKIAGLDQRTFPRDTGALTACRAMGFTVKEAGPVTLKIDAAENGFYIDRVVLYRPHLAPAAVPGPDETFVQPETFKLADAAVKRLGGGSQVVVFEKRSSTAEGSVTLQKGIYDLTVWLQAASPASDGFKLAVAGKEHDLLPVEYGEPAPTEPVLVMAAADGPCALKITADDAGFEIDRLVFRKHPPAPPPAAGETCLEVETFKLTNAEVKPLPGAGGDSAVFFGKEGGTAETTTKLEAGTYELTAYSLAPDAESDAFYLSVGNKEERIYPKEFSRLSPTRTIEVEIKEAGPCKLKVEAAEEGFYLDRLVLKKIK